MKGEEKDPEKSSKETEQNIGEDKSGAEASKIPEDKEVASDHLHRGGDLLIGGIIGVVIITILLIGSAFVARVANRGFVITRERVSVDRMGMHHFDDRGGIVFNNSISGKVTAVSGQTFTVDVSGRSKNVQITSSTIFPLSSATTVKVGDQVEVWGTQNSSGVIQAARIVVNP